MWSLPAAVLPIGPQTSGLASTRDVNSRGNTYPPSLWLADPQSFSAGGKFPGSFALPSWDCKSTGAPGNGARPATSTDQACWVAPTLPGAKPGQIPHILARELSEAVGVPGRRRRARDHPVRAMLELTPQARVAHQDHYREYLRNGDLTVNEKKVKAVGHMSVVDRVARGKTARAEVPRSSHAVYEPPRRRRDPLTLLEQQAKTRVPELVPIRYGRMLVSPFTFYRGAAKIMAEDLAATPRSGFMAQCCGDAHLSNFGLFASPERRLVFDLNDFDETLPGPWEWDVKRLAVSMLIAARDNGFGAKDQERAVLQTVGAYRSWMREFAAAATSTCGTSRLEAEQIMAEIARRGAGAGQGSEKIVAKAHTRDSMSAFEKLTERSTAGDR